MKKNNHFGLIDIHIAVLLFGLAGLFGKFLDLPAWCIVLGRTGFASITLGIVLIVVRDNLPGDFKTIGLFFLLGLLLAVHWIAFFKAIQVSTVAIGLLAFSTFPVFIALFEPWWFNEKRRKVDMLAALMVLVGLGVMVYPSPIGGRIFSGALYGTLAGFSFAVLSLLNRKWVRNYSPIVIAFFQNAFAALSLLPLIGLVEIRMDAHQIGLLAILGVFCTAFAHTLFIRSLNHIRAQLASIIACLEPVYGVAFAYLLLHEIPSIFTLVGGAIILLTTMLAMVQRAP